MAAGKRLRRYFDHENFTRFALEKIVHLSIFNHITICVLADIFFVPDLQSLPSKFYTFYFQRFENLLEPTK
jgi:hypothetical protein